MNVRLMLDSHKIKPSDSMSLIKIAKKKILFSYQDNQHLFNLYPTNMLQVFTLVGGLFNPGSLKSRIIQPQFTQAF